MIENLTETIHATLLSVFGIGVLLRGVSGAGKSDCALEMVSRGHALIADDGVALQRIGPIVYGSAPTVFKGFLEIRGIGICNIRDLYGETSVLGRCAIGVSVELKPEKNSDETVRIGGEQPEAEILGVRVPHFVISNSRKRPLPVIIEAAAKIVKAGGSSAGMDLMASYNKSLAS